MSIYIEITWGTGWPMPGRDLAPRAPVAGALLVVRQLQAALGTLWRNRHSGRGGPGIPPEDDQPRDSVWDDPELWKMIAMMQWMMH